jgi:hypothetical protein
MRLHIAMTLTLLAAVPAMAADVYRWVDENGVVNFSDTAPRGAETGGAVDTVTLQDAAPKDQEPGQDIYHVAAQAERMQALRDEMEKEREARREQQRRAAQQPAAPSSSGVNYGYPYAYPAYGRPPLRPGRPPAKPPARPVPELYDTATLRPPGSAPAARDG